VAPQQRHRQTGTPFETARSGRLRTWRRPIYAIVRTGGKQYRVEPNQTLDVERLSADVGSTVELAALLIGGNGDVQVGTPEVAGFQVVAEVVEHGRGEKIRVFKYKNKTRYRRRRGHRQEYTRLTIKEILSGGKSVAKAEEKKVVRPRSMAEPEPEPEEAPAAVAAEATVEEAPSAPKRARKPAKKKAEPAEEAADTSAEAADTTATSEATAKPKPKTTRPRASRKSVAEPEDEDKPADSAEE
jgi:large subunit ribosomal protein L21